MSLTHNNNQWKWDPVGGVFVLGRHRITPDRLAEELNDIQRRLDTKKAKNTTREDLPDVDMFVYSPADKMYYDLSFFYNKSESGKIVLMDHKNITWKIKSITIHEDFDGSRAYVELLNVKVDPLSYEYRPADVSTLVLDSTGFNNMAMQIV